MANAIELALMAGRIYQSTRGKINWLPDLSSLGWIERIDKTQSLPSGFEATYFTKGNEIVISFAGTGSAVDWWANAGGFFGVTSEQLEQAADYYLQVRTANPGAAISFTGHSLGGGLASLMAVFFGETAVTFDQAPFRNSASVAVATTLKNYLINQKGYSTSAVQGLSNFISAAASGGIPNESNVLDFSVQGEILSAASFARIGSQSSLTHNPVNWLGSSVDLHSQALLTAFLQSNQTDAAGKTLSDVTFKLTDLLRMIFDGKLFENPTASGTENFIERLVRHQNGVAGLTAAETPVTADAMLTRFTSDLWKLAQDGGLTVNDGNTNPDLHELSNALIAFAMQFYYENSANATDANKQLFTDLSTSGTGSNGIRFDMADVSTTFATAFTNNQKLNLSDAKGYQDFLFYLGQTNNGLNAEERQLINSLLPYVRDWYIQAGASGMNATDTLNRNAFMLGGSGSDALVGGTGSDLLVGNGGADLLQGKEGNDFLLGGTGNDTYIYTAGDGFDTILDAGGQGSIVYDGATLTGGAQFGDDRVHRDSNGHLYVDVGNGRFVIDGNILIEDHQAGKLGLTGMTGPASEVDPSTSRTIEGDYSPMDFDPASAGIQMHYDDLDNAILDLNSAAPDRADYLYDSGGNDHITSGGGNDIVYAYRGGDDVIEAGTGRDKVYGFAGDDVIMGGDEGDILSGGLGNDRMYADTQVSVTGAIAAGNSQSGSGQQGDWLAGGSGDDTLVGSTGNDVLTGGGGKDLLIGGAGDDDILGDTDWLAQSFDWTVTDEPQFRLFQPVVGESLPGDAAADVIYAGKGNDHAWGGVGNDVIFGEGGDDILSGNSGNDIILGGNDNDILRGDGISIYGETGTVEGHDYLDGGAGEDIIYGNGGDDILIGGTEIDQLYGGEGRDTYIFNRGDGRDTVFDTLADNNILRFGAGISSADITLNLGSLLINLGGGDEIHIDGFDRNDVFNSSSISGFEFADGTTLTTTELLARGFDLNGTNSDDTIYGTNTTDRINGLDGNDTLVGGAGNDTLDGGVGDDMLSGDGSNIIAAFNGDDVLNGGSGNDTLFGGGGNDTLNGGEGRDELQGGGDADTLYGETGDDTLLGEGGADTLYGGDGADTLAGGMGADTIYGGAGNDQIAGDNGGSDASGDADTIDGGDGDDMIDGQGGADTLLGGNGNDLISGGLGNDTLVGDSGTDQLQGGDGNDSLDGGADGDTLFGQAGDDILIGGAGSDSLVGGDGADTLNGGADNDFMWGEAGNDTLHGGDGNDTLQGGTGDDILDGGAGDDVYYYALGDGRDHITDSGGTDWLVLSNGATLTNLRLDVGSLKLVFSDGSELHLDDFDPNNPLAGSIEYIQFSNNEVMSREQMIQTLGFNIQGTSGDDVLSGTALGETITAYAGNDIITALGGNDTVNAGAGSDWVDAGDGNDTVTAGEGDDIVFGGNGSDILDGGAGSDTLDGGAGNDTLGGGAGNDTYVFGRGAGQDVVNDNDATAGNLDKVQMAAGVLPGDVTVGRSGVDLYLSISNPDGTTSKLTLTNWYSGDAYRIEQVVFADAANTVWDVSMLDALTRAPTQGADLIEGASGNDVLYGLGGNDTLNGYAGDDTLDGGTGDDYLYGGDGNDLLRGGDGFDLLQGDAGNDTLDGGAGNDSLRGNEGNDTYLFGRGSGQDIVWNYLTTTDNADRVEIAADLSPSDVIVSRDESHLFLSINNPDGTIDKLTLASWFMNDVSKVGQVVFADGTVWDQSAIRAMVNVPTEGADFIEGTSGNDVINGLGGNDTLNGYAGDDTLNGGTGNDFLYGGEGNDTYFFGRGSGQDVVYEYGTSARDFDKVQIGTGVLPSDVSAQKVGSSLVMRIANTGGTTDTLTLAYWFSGGAYGVDQVAFADGTIWDAAKLSAMANPPTMYSDVLYGSSGNDSINGLDGDDTIYGLAGDDTLDGGVWGNDTLYGGDGNDRLIGGYNYDTFYGGNGNDILDGSQGAGSTMSGGMGDDTYILGANPGDTIIEYANQGIDTVQSSIGYTLGDNIENLTLTGTNVINGTGNALDNVLTGNSAVNILTGDAGNDTLDGKAGGDKMSGGTGDDIYFVDSTKDIVTELLSEGTDTVKSVISHTLATNVEALTLTGATAINGTDNTLNNLLIGNSAINTLSGSTGNDILQGGAGNDVLKDSAGNNLFDGGAGADTLTGATGKELFIGGIGNDTITTSTGADIIAFNKGDGQDTVVASTGADNTISLGSGIGYQSLALSKSGSNLVLAAGNGDQITLQNWYKGTTNHSVLNLQVVLDNMTYNPASTDVLLNKRVQRFNFATIVSDFDTALVANPTMTSWSMTNDLLTRHLSGSDTDALGGDLAYQYNLNGSLSGIGLASAQTELASASFGAAPQQLQPLASLQVGAARLG